MPIGTLQLVQLLLLRFDDRLLGLNQRLASDQVIWHRTRWSHGAYNEVQRNFGRLIDMGELRLVMELSLELMKQGSHQVEMSDEGLMTYDIEECLQVVVAALRKCDLPPEDIIAWCKAMSKADRVKCVYDRELHALRKHAEAST